MQDGIQQFLETLGAEEPPAAPGEDEGKSLEKLSEKISKKEQEKRQVQALRTRLRLKAIEALLDGKLMEGVLIALGAGVMDLPRLSRMDTYLGQSLGEGAAYAGMALLSLPPQVKLKGSWPGGRGWLFIDPVLEAAAEAGQAEMVLHASKIALQAPLFLASLLPVAVSTWGVGEEALKLARVINEKAVPLVKGMRLGRILEPPPA